MCHNFGINKSLGECIPSGVVVPPDGVTVMFEVLISKI